jgi:hypothetical protein
MTIAENLRNIFNEERIKDSKANFDEIASKIRNPDYIISPDLLEKANFDEIARKIRDIDYMISAKLLELADMALKRLDENAETKFKPCLHYDSIMDWTILLTEDCSYRSKYINDYMQELYHPYEDRLVGFKITNVSRLKFNSLERINKLL